MGSNAQKRKGFEDRTTRDETRRVMNEEQAKRKRLFVILSIITVLLAVTGLGVGIAANINKASNADPAAQSFPLPSVVQNEESGIRVGADKKIVKDTPTGQSNVVIYQDYICPGCRAFETSYASQIEKILEDKIGTIEYRTIGALDSASAGTNYSSRAANVALCSAVANPDKFFELNQLFYKEQPKEGTSGLPNAKLIDLAKQTGTEGIESCVKDGTYRPYVKKLTSSALDSGDVTVTPTVLVNDKPFNLGGDLYTTVKKANEEMGKKGGASSVSTTPSK